MNNCISACLADELQSSGRDVVVCADLLLVVGLSFLQAPEIDKAFIFLSLLTNQAKHI